MTERPIPQRPEAWGDVADDYADCFVPVSAGAARAVLERVPPRVGARWLDVAAGTGAVTLQAASGGASVLAVDFSAGMLARLESERARARLAGVETRVMDGQDLALDDASFDVAGSNFGLIFFADPARGLAELRRVLRPDGRVFVTSMSAQAESPLMQLIVRALWAADANLRPAASPVKIELASVSAMEDALAAAGFRDAHADLATVPWPIADAADFWRRWATEAPPVAAMMRSIPVGVRDAAGRIFVRLVDEAFPAGGAAFPTRIVIGTARR